MPQIEAIPFDRAAVLEDISKEALKKRLQRRRIVYMKDPNHRQRRLVPITALSPDARTAHFKQQTCSALEPLAQQPQPSGNSGPGRELLLPFAPPGETEQALLNAAPPGIPAHQRGFVEKWSAIIGDCANGTWKRYRGTDFEGFAIEGSRDFVRALAHQHGIGVSTIYSKLKLLRQIQRDPAIPPDRKQVEFLTQILHKPKPGRSGHTFFHEAENLWMGLKLESFYLTQAKLSAKRSHELLLAEIDAKQKASGLSHLYQKPTLQQSRTYLSKIDMPTDTLAREGEKAYQNRCAPYISRRNNLRSNQLWVTDQKLYDVRLRDGGERLGRVWAVNVLDVASWRWLGGAVGPYLSGDLVMDAYAMALQRAGVPRRIQMDLGKEFIGKRFLGGRFNEKIFDDTVGMWERLGVQVVKAIGRNPQSKTIERWHREIDRWTQELPGWCGNKPTERPEKLAHEEAEHTTWLKTGRGRSPLIKVDQFIREFFEWAEGRWNAAHRSKGKYLQGMTPTEAWNTRLPEEGLRRLTPSKLDYYTADRRFVKVGRGGQVNLTFYGQTIEYVAPELFNLLGQRVEVLVSRLNPRKVTVNFEIAGGWASCTAVLKPQHDWLPEDRQELKLALRCRAAARRALKRGIEASRALDEADNPLELVAVAQERKVLPASFGAPALPPCPRREKTRFADERGAAVLATLDEEEVS